MNTRNFFEQNKYVVIKNAISKEMADFLYYYTKLETRQLIYLEEQGEEAFNKFNFDKQFGEFTDPMIPGSFSKYGDLTFDTLCLTLLPKMCEWTGLDLIPTYSYHRLYRHGDILEAHRDRKECEISTTLCLGYDVSNLKEEHGDDFNDYNWPIYMLEPNKPQNEAKEVLLEPGDMVLYKGQDLFHWRTKYMGVNHSQVFLHYNKREDGNLYDGRPELGMSNQFRKI